MIDTSKMTAAQIIASFAEKTPKGVHIVAQGCLKYRPSHNDKKLRCDLPVKYCSGQKQQKSIQENSGRNNPYSRNPFLYSFF
ncbi:hypothetical protein [Butyrivibrio sp. AD3002]|uniref:hypothetical protein n=1 Tax=Butyrivibrio sp. AD3002 TaxID=1280670 RepID=UPI0018CA8D03|nr:hypothetical protein [Butyrivibrio sp. AD3002]